MDYGRDLICPVPRDCHTENATKPQPTNSMANPLGSVRVSVSAAFGHIYLGRESKPYSICLASHTLNLHVKSGDPRWAENR